MNNDLVSGIAIGAISAGVVSAIIGTYWERRRQWKREMEQMRQQSPVTAAIVSRKPRRWVLDFDNSSVVPSATGGAMLGASAGGPSYTGAMLGTIAGAILGGLAGALRVSYEEKPLRMKIGHSTHANWLTSTTPLALAIGVGGCFGALFGIYGALVGVIAGLTFGIALLKEKHRDQSNQPTDEHEV